MNRLTLLQTLLPLFAAATNPFEAPGNQIALGFWANPYENGTSPAPADVNSKLGINASIFQMSQYIPLAPVDAKGIGGAIRSDLIEATNTTAAVFLTVYPFQGFDAVQQSDLDLLASQVAALKTPYNRTVFLRYAPEMQGGGWNVYGNQPTAFVAQWQLMANTVRAQAPDVQLVWSPNTGQGYPWGQSFPGGANAAADEKLLDTNGDGTLDAADDPYSPYWPGPQWVDWAGMSIYYDISNDEQPLGFCAAILDGYDPLRQQSMAPFYSTYCEAATGASACMISECATGFHTGDGSGAGVGEVALKQDWINDCVTNATFLDSHPRLKAITQFEFAKAENYETGTSDHRWTSTDAVAAMASGLLAGFGDRIAWASAVPTASTSSSAAASGSASSAGASPSAGSGASTGGDTGSGTRGVAFAWGTAALAAFAGAVVVL